MKELKNFEFLLKKVNSEVGLNSKNNELLAI